MRAIGVRNYGGPDALEEIDLPLEPLHPGQVRIRVTAAAVSPSDTMRRSGAYMKSPTAENVADVPGAEVAGVLSEIGPDTSTDLAPGDRVMAVVTPLGQHGAYRDDIVLSAASVVGVPAGFSDAQASTLPMNGLTAWVAIENLALKPGQAVAVTGAAGTVGSYVIQLAKTQDLIVIADAKPGTDEDLVRDLGADYVIARGEGIAERIRDLLPDGVDGLVDVALQGAEVLPAIKDGGRLATLRGWDGSDLPDRNRVEIHPVHVYDNAERTDVLTRLKELAESGNLRTRILDILPASQATRAHERFERGGLRGRLVLDFTSP